MNRLGFLALVLLATSLAAGIVMELGGGDSGEDATGIVAVRHAPLPKARAPAEDPVDHTEEWVADILARPLFSRDRRPTPVVAKSGGDTVVATLPRLTGVMVGPFGRAAIFAGPEGGKALTVMEGAALGPYTVQAITPGRVTVTGPEGVRELSLVYDASVRRAVTAEAPPQPTPPQPLPPGLRPGLNLRPSQFQRAISNLQQQSPDQ